MAAESQGRSSLQHSSYALFDIMAAKTRAEIRSWLLGASSDLDQPQRYQDSLQRKLAGTCDWILHTPEYLAWNSPDSYNAPSKVLWVNGPAGFGKTILAAHIVHHIVSTEETHKSLVVHHFFSSQYANKDDPHAAVRSWIAQLMSKNLDAFQLARNQWTRTEDRVATRATIIQLLREIFQKCSCTIVIDGLDECVVSGEEWAQNPVTELLENIGESISDTTRVLIISRDESQIRQALCQHEGLVELRLSSAHVRADTTRVACDIVDRRLPNKTAELRASLSDRMVNRCDGQFLWLTMQGGSLARGMTTKQLKNTIDTTDPDLNRLYDRNWNIITGQKGWKRDRAISILRWAVFAVRPMSVMELAEALQVDEDPDEFSLDDFPKIDDVDEDYIDSMFLELCAPLLEVRGQTWSTLPGDRKVYVPHFTIKQYLVHQLPCKTLLKEQGLQATTFARARVHMTLLSRTCLYFVLRPEVWDRDNLYFLDYAAASWGKHLECYGFCIYEIDQDTMLLVLSLLNTDNTCYKPWAVFYESRLKYDFDAEGEDWDGDSTDSRCTERGGTDEESGQGDSTDENSMTAKTGRLGPLFYAITLELTEVAVRLLWSVSDPDLNSPSLEMSRVIREASSRANITVVQALLDVGVNADLRDLKGITPMAAAAWNGQLEMVQFLIEKGAEIDLSDNDGVTPLFAACIRGHENVAQFLLEMGADIHHVCSGGYGPLLYASGNGHIDTVRLLIVQGADVNQSLDGQVTSLFLAACFNHLEVVRILLDNGADALFAGESRETPLLAAVLNRHVELSRLLIERGANVSCCDKFGAQPLYHAARLGAVDLVKLLVENGADIHSKDSNDETPLHRAAMGGHVDTLRLLVDKGANINVTDDVEFTALHYAACKGHAGAGNFLFDAGADVEASDQHGRRPLHIASWQGHIEMVKMLIDRGADVEASDQFGLRPVHIAIMQGHIEMVKMLID